MSAEAFAPEHFRDVILARMRELDLDNQTIGQVGGPSTTKMSGIRRPDPKEPRVDVYRKLDEALRWEKGSARRVAFGGQPKPLPNGLDDLVAEVRASNIPGAEQDRIIEILLGDAAKGKGVRKI